MGDHALRGDRSKTVTQDHIRVFRITRRSAGKHGDPRAVKKARATRLYILSPSVIPRRQAVVLFAGHKFYTSHLEVDLTMNPDA